MAKNLADALLPLQLVSKFCALGHSEYFSGRLNIYVNNLYIITFWFIYYSIIVYLQYHKIWISFKLLISFIMYNSHLFTTAISIIYCMHFRQIFKQCLQKISIINDTLEGLHIPNEYNNLRKKAIHNIIVWILVSIAINLTQITWYKEKVTGIKLYFVAFFINYTIHVNSLTEILYGTLMWYITSIFQRMNEFILHLSMSKNCGIETMWTTFTFRNVHHCSLIDTSQHKYSLLTIMHAHRELSKTCHKLHKMFQILLTAGVVTNFTVITGFLYFQYVYLANLSLVEKQFLESSMSSMTMILFLVGKVIFLNNHIEKCCKEAYHTQYILHILRDFTFDSERQEEISQFILQVVQKKLRMSAMGLFYFGHKFLCTYFTIIINYVIIAIQLHGA